MPVSYTHLDVYKRQILCRADHRCRKSCADSACLLQRLAVGKSDADAGKERIPGSRRVHDIYLTSRINSGVPVRINKDRSVSSHGDHHAGDLDVYKRQLQQLPDLRNKQIERNIVLSAVDNDIGEKMCIRDRT